MTTMTISANNGLEKGDIMVTPIHNKLRKIIWHWIFQIPLKREEWFEVTSVDSETTVTINE